ncbi:MAG: hypothetical protein NPIRA04_08910 [Nitrospirales bacterium]|nr:MAG: hypothetical protein NPIRA04_08910 [Nitrospirales bacterium]
MTLPSQDMKLEQAITTRILLKERMTLSGMSFKENPSIAVGLLFIVLGLAALSEALGWRENFLYSTYVPLWIVGVGGIICLSGGLWLTVHGIRDRRRIWNMKHGKQQLSRTPWLWDYPWEARGATDSCLKSALRSLMGLLLFSVVASPFNWMAFFWEGRSFFLQGTVGLLDLVIIMSIGGRFLTKLRQYVTFGNSRLDFHDFPYFLGNPMSLTLKNVPSNISTLHLTLRCIEEATPCEETKDEISSGIACYQVYNDTQILKRERVQPGDNLDLYWMLPEDETLSSTPSERPATYWELEVTAAGHHLNYQSRFLLPIYAQLSS